MTDVMTVRPAGPGDASVLPGHDGAALALLERLEDRARHLAGGVPEGRLRLQLNIEPTLDLSLLTGRGYRTVRRYQVMNRPVSTASDLPPAPPEGITLRHCAADEADRRRAHALVEEKFAAHFGHVDRPYEAWLDYLDGPAPSTGPWCGSRTCPATATWAYCSLATTAPAWAGSATSAYGPTCAAGASAGSCCATASPPTRPAAGTSSAWAWTSGTRPAHSGRTRRTG
ncbi:hypothetical protein ACFVGY_10215 [Streptomyces sp. NPDC127106]|uniref:hypothetical protein n=1 Tax=Streptomyces sp. NPDC127106 TaxID=3345360 RepID=UPI0036408623